MQWGVGVGSCCQGRCVLFSVHCVYFLWVRGYWSRVLQTWWSKEEGREVSSEGRKVARLPHQRSLVSSLLTLLLLSTFLVLLSLDPSEPGKAVAYGLIHQRLVSSSVCICILLNLEYHFVGIPIWWLKSASQLSAKGPREREAKYQKVTLHHQRGDVYFTPQPTKNMEDRKWVEVRWFWYNMNNTFLAVLLRPSVRQEHSWLHDECRSPFGRPDKSNRKTYWSFKWIISTSFLVIKFKLFNLGFVWSDILLKLHKSMVHVNNWKSQSRGVLFCFDGTGRAQWKAAVYIGFIGYCCIYTSDWCHSFSLLQMLTWTCAKISWH